MPGWSTLQALPFRADYWTFPNIDQAGEAFLDRTLQLIWHFRQCWRFQTDKKNSWLIVIEVAIFFYWVVLAFVFFASDCVNDRLLLMLKNFFSLSLMAGKNKLECLYLAFLWLVFHIPVEYFIVSNYLRRLLALVKNIILTWMNMLVAHFIFA